MIIIKTHWALGEKLEITRNQITNTNNNNLFEQRTKATITSIKDVILKNKKKKKTKKNWCFCCQFYLFFWSYEFLYSCSFFFFFWFILVFVCWQRRIESHGHWWQNNVHAHSFKINICSIINYSLHGGCFFWL